MQKKSNQLPMCSGRDLKVLLGLALIELQDGAELVQLEDKNY